MTVGKTRGEIEQLVAQVGPLVNEAMARVNIVRSQLKPKRSSVFVFNHFSDRVESLTAEVR